MASDTMTTATGNPTTGRWLHEPLLHFALLGLLLFGIDALMNRGADDQRRIVMNAQVDAEAIALFSKARGRAPSAQELEALRTIWLDNEVLYREGLALQVDRGDPAIRERIIFKALSVVEAGLSKPATEELVVKEWFEANRGRYDQPPRFDFREAVPSGETSKESVESLVSLLNAGEGGDVEASLRVFTARPRSNLVQTYGEEFTLNLEKSEPGKWVAIKGAKHWRAIQLEAAVPGKAADFSAVASAVAQDWLDTTMSEHRTAAVRKLAEKYEIVREVPAP
jgi:hypothetical protein